MTDDNRNHEGDGNADTLDELVPREAEDENGGNGDDEFSVTVVDEPFEEDFDDDSLLDEEVDPEQVRTQNRGAERTGLQRVVGGISNVLGAVNGGRETDIDETSSAINVLSAVEGAYKDASDQIIEDSKVLQDRAAQEKTRIERAAIEEDLELSWDEEDKRQIEHVLDSRVSGGEVDGSYRFGAVESIVNTSFLMEDVVNMRNVEDNSYTQGEKDGTSLPFIERADIRDEDARGWVEDFHQDQEGASNALNELVGIYNLNERLSAYNQATDRYNAGSVVTEDLEELDNVEAVALEDINGELEGEVTEETLEAVRNAAALVGEDLNGREEGYEGAELNPEERQKAEELARQGEARALDRVALHAGALETAREELGELKEDLSEKKQALAGYEDEGYGDAVEDLTRVDGVGDAFSELLEDIGVETVMDLAARNDLAANREFQRRKQETDVRVPNSDKVISNAYDALDEIAEDYGEIMDFDPTTVIQQDGSDYHPRDQMRRQMEAVYDSSEVLTRMFGALEGQIPDLDQYEPEWDGDYDSLEEERQAFYEEELGIVDLPEPEEALNYERHRLDREE